MKYCPRCNKELEISCYTDGITYCDYCIDTRRAYRTANEPHYSAYNYYYYESKKEKVLERTKKWYSDNNDYLKENAIYAIV